MDLGFLNYTDDNQLDKPIYRVFTTKRLLEVINTGELTLVKPKLWDDPYENYLMNSMGKLQDGQQFSIQARNHFYGQCWTKTKESDAIWRIYAPDKDGVKVQTTPRKLLSSLLANNPQPKGINIQCYIGNVQYIKRGEITKYLTELPHLITDSTGAGMAKTLLLKRYPFKHENEVRLLFNSMGKASGNIYKFPISQNIFDKIVFDPRMDDTTFKIHKTYLRSKKLFTNPIIKSGLYKEPKFTFEFNL